MRITIQQLDIELNTILAALQDAERKQNYAIKTGDVAGENFWGKIVEAKRADLSLNITLGNAIKAHEAVKVGA